MRKITVILLIIVGNLVCFSQIKTNKVKWVYNNLDLNSVTENSGSSTVYGEHGEILRVDEPSEHLKFKGIPITGTKDEFGKKLIQKGIRGRKNFRDKQIFFKSKGVDCQVLLYNPPYLLFTFYGDDDDQSNKMSVVNQEYIFWKNKKSNINVNNFIMNLRKEIIRGYNCISREDFSEYDFYFSPSIYSLYKISDESKEVVIGEIIVGIKENIDSYVVFVTYCDNTNFKSCKTLIQNGTINWIDYSKYFPKYDEILFADDNEFVRCYLKINGNPYSFIFGDDDKKIILTILSNLKIPYVKNIMYYLLNEILFDWLENKYTFISQNNFRNSYNDLLAEYKKQSQQNKQKKQARQFGFMDIMHMLAPGFFTQDDVDLWNKMPEENQKAVINGAFGVFGSMGGSTWDSLSPEQKMQIHQNDNAR